MQQEFLTDFALTVDQAESYADKRYWPMNDKSCHNYGGCIFREICSKSPGVRENFLQGSFKHDFAWDPTVTREA